MKLNPKHDAEMFFGNGHKKQFMANQLLLWLDQSLIAKIKPCLKKMAQSELVFSFERCGSGDGGSGDNECGY